MVTESILIPGLVSTFVLLVVGGFVRRRSRKKSEARNWYGENIKIITKIIDRSKRELDREDELDLDRLMADLEPFVTDINAQVNDSRGAVSETQLQRLEKYSNFLQNFEENAQRYKRNSPEEFISHALENGADSLRESDKNFDFDAPLDEALSDNLLQMYDHDEIQNTAKNVKLEKKPELMKLVLSELDEEELKSGTQVTMNDLLDFPYKEFSEFGEFEEVLELGLEITIQQYVEVSLITFSSKLRDKMKKAQEEL